MSAAARFFRFRAAACSFAYPSFSMPRVPPGRMMSSGRQRLEVEIDIRTGFFANHTRGIEHLADLFRLRTTGRVALSIRSSSVDSRQTHRRSSAKPLMEY